MHFSWTDIKALYLIIFTIFLFQLFLTVLTLTFKVRNISNSLAHNFILVNCIIHHVVVDGMIVLASLEPHCCASVTLASSPVLSPLIPQAYLQKFRSLHLFRFWGYNSKTMQNRHRHGEHHWKANRMNFHHMTPNPLPQEISNCKIITWLWHNVHACILPLFFFYIFCITKFLFIFSN